MIDTLAHIDADLTVAVNSVHSVYLDHFMYLFTNKYVWAPMYATILIILYKRYNIRAALLFVVAIAFTIAITDQLCATVLRPMVERLRPTHDNEQVAGMIHIVNGYRGGLYGFPSCHAANSFALVTFLALMRRRALFITAIVLWAIINAYSRLYLGVHFVGDLVAGALIGIIIGTSVFAIAHKIHGMRWFAGEPQLATVDNATIYHSITTYDLFIFTFIFTTAIIALLAL